MLRAQLVGLLTVVAVACAAGRPAEAPPPVPTADRLPLIPYPRRLEQKPGKYMVSGTSRVREALGASGPSSYSLDVDASGIRISAGDEAGLFYARKTLAQLGSVSFPFVHIEDAPRFAWRGLLLDTVRHFYSVADVERVLDWMASYKLNVFHWHLTDDQGWRLEVRSHPELTAIGAHRHENGADYTGYYTQDDVKRVVAYAKARHIMVVPEIEMPGHSRAVLAAHPELGCSGERQPVPITWGVFEDVLCAGNDGVFSLMDDVLGDVAELFPGPYIHVGGDEVPATRWSACPKCRARMAREKIDQPEKLAGYFLKRAAALVEKRKKRLIGWDELVDTGLTADATIMSWRGTEGGQKAAASGHDVVMQPAPALYFDMRQAGLPDETGQPEIRTWRDVLAFEPMPLSLDAAARAHILGVQGAMWTEYVPTRQVMESRLFPRMLALAEIAWSERAPSPEAFGRRLAAHAPLLDSRAIEWFIEPPSGLARQKAFTDQAEIAMSKPAWLPGAEVHFTLDGSTPTKDSPRYREPVRITESARVTAATFLPSGRKSLLVRGSFEKQTPRAPLAVSPAKPGVGYRYVEGTFDKVPAFEGLPARSGTLSAFALPSERRPEDFAVEYRALLKLPADGLYRFAVASNDGSVLDVDGVRLVDNDGPHAEQEVTGEVVLAAGVHALRLGYFQRKRASSLHVFLEGPGLAGREIGSELLFLDPR
jgi:hexosaminidase